MRSVFTCSIFCLLPLPAFTQTTLQYGNAVPGTIDCGQTARYTLNVNQGDKLIAHVTESRDRGGICPTPYGNVAACAFDQCIEVRDDLGRLLETSCSPLESNACTHHTRTQLGPITVERSGAYTVSVRDGDNFGRGDYVLYVQTATNPAGATPVAVPDSRLVDVQSAGQVRAFAFSAAEGSHVSIEMKPQPGAAVEPRLALYGPAGDSVALPDSGRLQYKVRQGGQHSLLAFSSLSQTGVSQMTLSPAPLPYPNPVVSQIADGNGWRTTLILVNPAEEATPFEVRTWSDSGASWALSWDTSPVGTIPAGGFRALNTLNRAAVTSQGWAEIVSPRPVGVQAIFRSAGGQEATVGAITGAARFLLPFDNTQDFITAMALVNANPAAVALITARFRDEAGTLVGSETLTLAPREHRAFTLPARFPSLTGRRGVAEFSSELPDLAALGLRFTPTGAFTSFPVQP